MRLIIAVGCAALLASTVHAEEWPSGPIRMVVNAAPGGVADRAVRVMGPHLNAKLGQPIVIENRPGGEGYIGQQEVSRARPDGRTFLFTAGSMIVITPQLVPRSDFDPRKSLTPVAPAVRIPMNLVVHPAGRPQTAADLIKFAKANPGKLSYGSAGSGTALHIAAETFAREIGAKLTHVPYKGAGPALQDLVGGHIDLIFDPGLATEHVKAGRLKLLAVATSQRNPAFPDVPTFEELGVKGVDGGPYFGFYAPNNVPADVIGRLNATVASVLALAEVRAALQNMSLDIAPPMAPEAFARYVQTENQRYEKLLPELGIRAQ